MHFCSPVGIGFASMPMQYTANFNGCNEYPHSMFLTLNKKTSSPKDNDRSPDSKSSKYFECSQIKDFLNWSRAACFAVHALIRPNFKLI